MPIGAEELKKYMQKIAWMLNEIDEAEKSCCGVSLAQSHAIMEIGEAGTLSLVELADKLNLDKSTLSRTVNQLVSRGLCVRAEQVDDRRYVSISLTEEGLLLFNKIRSGLDEYFKGIYAAIPDEKRAAVLESAELLLQAIRGADCCGQ